MKNNIFSPLKWGLACGALLASSGCASIVSDSLYTVTICSSSPGANFVVKEEDSGNIVHMGKTPQTVVLKSGNGFFRGAEYRIEAEIENYARGYLDLQADIDPWYCGNILFGGWCLFGFLIVDPATGAMWELPERVTVGLYPSASGKTVLPDFNRYENNAEVKQGSAGVKRTTKGVKNTAKGVSKSLPSNMGND